MTSWQATEREVTGPVHSRASPTRRGSRAGFSLIEVLVAIVILTVAVCGVSSSMISALTLNRVNRETAIAEAAARRMMEQAGNTEFQRIFATYNTNPADDPTGPGTSPGANFVVFGLTPNDDDADGRVGEISFPVIDVAGVPQLREDVVDAGLGMPRDLNGDGPDLVDHSDNYRVLPIRVRISWRGLCGPRTLTTEGMLAAR